MNPSSNEKVSVFAGRHQELNELESALADALGGRGRVVLVSGEPGIGKSALVDEFAERTRRRGMSVAWARCWESGGAPPFWPWMQLLRVAADPSVIESLDPTVRRWIAPLAPELVRLDEAAPVIDSDQARFAMFDAVAALVRELGRATPCLLVIDDLHAADVPSVQLLRFLEPQLRSSRCLLIATHRVEELKGEPEKRSLIGEIGRGGSALDLVGLQPEELGLLIEGIAGISLGGDSIRVLHEATGGNPFFASELIRLLGREGRLEVLRRGQALPLPESVRDVLVRRIERLSPDDADALAAIAVIGREFERAVVDLVLGDVAGRALDAATAEGLVEPLSEGSGRLRFRHALIQATLYGSLLPSRREALHLKVAEALELVHENELEPVLASLAQHYSYAAGDGARRKAFFYAVGAGARARKLLAYEEAVDQYARAIALASAIGASDEDRCELLLSYGEALVKSGVIGDGRTAFLDAWDLAKGIENASLMARAALGYGRAGPEAGVVDETLVRLIEGAMAGIEEGSPLSARLSARLAAELTLDRDVARREALVHGAIADARRSEDPLVIMETLRFGFNALASPWTSEDCISYLTEVDSIARAHGDVFTRAEAIGRLTIFQLELELMDALETGTAHLAAIAERYPLPLHRWMVTVDSCRRALMRGDLTAAAELSAEGLQFAEHLPNALPTWANQQFVLKWEQDELADVEAMMTGFRDARPGLSDIVRSALAWLYAETGRPEQARPELQALVANLDGYQVRLGWLAGIGWLAQAAYLLEDVSAEVLYDALLPFVARHAAFPGAVTSAYWGSVERMLGNLAHAMGSYDLAVEHGERGLAAHGRVGAVAFVARSQYDLARALLARAAADDGDRARRLLAEAEATAARMGLVNLARRIEMVELARPHVTGPPSIAKEGEYWTIRKDDVITRLKDSKGVGYLVALLERPNEEVHVLDLVSATGKRPAPVKTNPREVTISTGGAGDVVLDARARDEYKQRIKDLQDELQEAEDFNDTARASRAREEMDFLMAELGRSLGVGGRARNLGTSDAERARVNVTKALRSTIDKIGESDAGLGKHLDANVKTGIFCGYLDGVEPCLEWQVSTG